MNICLISDNNFIIYVSTLIVSILKNSSDDDYFHFHIIEDGSISDENKKKLNNLKRIKNFDIDFYVSNNIEKYKNWVSYIKKRNPNHSWNYMVWLKLDIPILLKDIDSVLLLDADMIILDRINDIFEIDVSNYYCISQQFYYTGIKEKLPEIHKYMLDIGIKQTEDEYLSGSIILFNLKKIKNYNNYDIEIDTCWERYKDIIFTEEHMLLYLFRNHILYKDLGADNIMKNASKDRKPRIITYYFTGNGNKPLNMNFRERISEYYYKFWEYFSLTDYFMENTIEYMNIYSFNKYKSIFYRILDKILWYVPIRKIRYSLRYKMENIIREYLSKAN